MKGKLNNFGSLLIYDKTTGEYIKKICPHRQVLTNNVEQGSCEQLQYQLSHAYCGVWCPKFRTMQQIYPIASQYMGEVWNQQSKEIVNYVLKICDDTCLKFVQFIDERTK